MLRNHINLHTIYILLHAPNKTHMNNSLESANPVDRGGRQGLATGLDLHRKTVAELKQIIGALEIPTRRISTMKKHELRQHIERFLLEASSLAVIGRFVALYKQTFFTRLLAKLRGDVIGTLELCVNETDFYTLEPLRNIPHEQYYSVFENGFWYGFDIFSLNCLISKRGARFSVVNSAINPYTRTPFGEETRLRVLRIMRVMKIQRHINKKRAPSIVQEEKEPASEPPIEFPMIPLNYNNNIIAQQAHNNRFMGNNIYPPRPTLSALQCQMLDHLMEMRHNQPTIDSRITQLFMEIDYLGNYTDSRWFRDLTTNGAIRLFNFLQDFWENQRHMSPEVKWQICSLTGSPFYNIFIVNFNALTRDEIVEACVLVMENMVFTGCDEDARKLGAMQVLMNLANVSDDARRSLPWF